MNEVTHEEHCWFELGTITLGSCPGGPDPSESAAAP